VIEEMAQSTINEIRSASHAGRALAVWRAVDKLTNRKARPHTIVAASSFERRKALLVRNFSAMLKAPSLASLIERPNCMASRDGSIFCTSAITELEIKSALEQMSPDAAPGLDGIPARVLKLSGLLQVVTRVVNAHSPLSDKNAPSEWRTATIVAIPKKGSSTALDNQRGISLICVSAKLSNKVLLRRLQPHIMSHLLPHQSGFLPDRTTIEQIATLRLVVDSCRARQRSMSVVFVDFRKAFDCIARPAIARCLSFHGVPDVLITAVMDLYEQTTATVKTAHGPTTSFRTSTGVLQGDTLA
jgi:hypothetical protein